MLAGASGHTLHHVESIADGTRTPPPRRVPRLVIIELVVVALITAAIGVYVLVRVRQHQEGLLIRPTGIPASVSTQTADLMTLSPVPVTSAPGFTLTDQTGHTMSLASLRGKVVVLEFMDPHCTDICPIVSQEFVTAYRDLGRLASRVVFIAVNVNQYHLRVADVAAFSREQRLTKSPHGTSSPGLTPASARYGRPTTSRSQHPAPTPTSSTPRRCTSSTARAVNATWPAPWQTTPPPGRPTCPPESSPPGDKASPR